MEVSVGATVFVPVLGGGQVTRVLPGGAGFMVKVGQTEKQFDMDGRIGGSGPRRVYWADPVVVEPSKCSRLWLSWSRLAKQLWDEMDALHRSGLLPETEPEQEP